MHCARWSPPISAATEVAFADGNVQVVDFNGQTHGHGTYKLLDFAAGRHVKIVQLLAKSKSEETKLTVYLRKL